MSANQAVSCILLHSCTRDVKLHYIWSTPIIGWRGYVCPVACPLCTCTRGRGTHRGRPLSGHLAYRPTQSCSNLLYYYTIDQQLLLCLIICRYVAKMKKPIMVCIKKVMIDEDEPWLLMIKLSLNN